MQKKIFKIYGTILNFLPHAIIFLEIYLIYIFAKSPSILIYLSILLLPYLLPVLLYRINCIFLPIQEGAEYVKSDSDINWQIGFKFQVLFGAIPQLEKFLIALGIYSYWLRLWGSKIGKKIYWTSHTQVLDRNGLDLGDNIFFGHETVLCSHVTNFKNGKAIIYFKKIKIENNVFIGARSMIAPGTKIKEGVKVPFQSRSNINQLITANTFNTDNLPLG